MLRPFRDGPAFVLPVMAHVQVWGALHILPSRAIEDLFGAQLFVHWHYCPRAAPQGVRLMQRRVRSEAAPFATRPLAVPKPGCRPLPEMLSVQRATQSAGVAARATYMHSNGGLATHATSTNVQTYFRAGRALVPRRPAACTARRNGINAPGTYVWLPSRPTRGRRSAWRNCEQCNMHSTDK